LINKAILCGRLTKSPELRSTASGVSVCSFTVAIPRKYAKQGEERQTDFINCVAFGKTAEFVGKWFGKGDLISVDGSIQTRTWEDNEGKRRYATEVIVSEAGFVGGKSDNKQSTVADELPSEFGDISSDDDLPF